ncbi:MAG: DUF1538 domain-containing protein [Gammaproteobacteria bacterium]|nr:DUF1538 domain-containing protein [Gammaproteobacteria bacterium]
MSALFSFFPVFLSTLLDVLPIALVIVFFQFAVIRRKFPEVRKVIMGMLFVLFGMTLFLLGLEQALFPIGRLMAEQLTAPELINASQASLGLDGEDGTIDWRAYYWVYIFAFAIGASTTIAEPALTVVAGKANQISGGTISNWGLRIAVAIGVAVGITLGCYRIVTGLPVHYFIIAGYALVVLQTLRAPRAIIALAYDSGGVTTSTVTVPLVAALGLGLAESVPGREPMIDGFGLIAFASLFPIASVLAYAQFTEYLAHRKNQIHLDEN